MRAHRLLWILDTHPDYSRWLDCLSQLPDIIIPHDNWDCLFISMHRAIVKSSSKQWKSLGQWDPKVILCVLNSRLLLKLGSEALISQWECLRLSPGMVVTTEQH
jgi:hypothetical protein